ncbi:unnamed protein product [Microthlaspi erraticum]|uniref:B box-type domain-containing protein n=1 Tax=Microthlaspi erraticum TaxID=1685480 RepID=A0A6D2J1H4_9BRAS|nr:unnamed protein product [Microthlaspi erraticum]
MSMRSRGFKEKWDGHACFYLIRRNKCIQCDVCENAPATVICCADEAALCPNCDVQIHAANKLASTHQRLHLDSLSTKFPRCNICQGKANEVVIVGGGYIGMEVAAAAASLLSLIHQSLSCLLLSPRTYARRAEEHMIRLFRYKSKFLRIASGEVLQQRKATYFPDQDEKKVEAARRQPLLKETISAAKESDAVPLGAIGGDDSLASDEKKEMQKSEGTPDPPSTKATQAFQSKKLQNMHLLESLDEVSTWVDVRILSERVMWEGGARPERLCFGYRTCVSGLLYISFFFLS